MPPIGTARYIAPAVTVADGEYKAVAASQTGATLGASGGAKGDVIFGVLIVPATLAAAGVVTIIDGSTSIPLLPAGTFAGSLAPIWVPLNILSVNGAWSITTGANLSVIVVGKFS